MIDAFLSLPEWRQFAILYIIGTAVVVAVIMSSDEGLLDK